MGGEPIRVIMVDDHLMFAEGLTRLLDDERDITIVGLASSGQQALTLASEVSADVALVDYHLDDTNGVTLAGNLLEQQPGLAVIILTGADEDQLMLAAIRAGCAGFLTKDRAAGQVADAVRAVASGEALISAHTLARLLPLMDRTPTYKSLGADLTERERDVLTRMSYGIANRVVAEELFLSVNTVRNYTQSILNKLGAHSKLEAVSLAVSHGIIDYPAR